MTWFHCHVILLHFRDERSLRNRLCGLAVVFSVLVLVLTFWSRSDSSVKGEKLVSMQFPWTQSCCHIHVYYSCLSITILITPRWSNSGDVLLLLAGDIGQTVCETVTLFLLEKSSVLRNRIRWVSFLSARRYATSVDIFIYLNVFVLPAFFLQYCTQHFMVIFSWAWVSDCPLIFSLCALFERTKTSRILCINSRPSRVLRWRPACLNSVALQRFIQSTLSRHCPCPSGLNTLIVKLSGSSSVLLSKT